MEGKLAWKGFHKQPTDQDNFYAQTGYCHEMTAPIPRAWNPQVFPNARSNVELAESLEGDGFDVNVVSAPSELIIPTQDGIEMGKSTGIMQKRILPALYGVLGDGDVRFGEERFMEIARTIHDPESLAEFNHAVKAVYGLAPSEHVSNPLMLTLVSRDTRSTLHGEHPERIVDGHHRWSSMLRLQDMMRDLSGDPTLTIDIPVLEANLPGDQPFDANWTTFLDTEGVEFKGFGAGARRRPRTRLMVRHARR